ncbi:lactose-binding lectin l-2-like isoform X2 [Epinephelus lanceolatus]|uniref:type-2 ice-structuring protein-like isoform X2 n=1 Tax=Epinephelus lanceolatus TaxID=310571 RepID=UPI0014480E40|nr:type-2 ice-structuring protein-like isoform X2 [Epinephelus lanceolatus]
MKMLTVSALLCALLVLTRATSPAEGENDTETEVPTESAPAPSAPAGGENDAETEEPTESIPPPSEEGPGAEDLHVVTLPPTSVPTPIYDDFGFHHFGFSCPDGWTMFDTRCLLYVPENMTWTEAEQNCQSGNGDFHAYGNLASVFEEYYFDEIQEVMQKAGHKSGQVWVGGSKAPGGSSWSWSDYMSPNIFPNWCSKEPSKENCLKINFEENASGCLEGSPCDAELPSVCSMFLM